jgi:hypothetical protein
MIAEDPEWRPWHTHHGEHRRIFTQFEEVSIVSFILDHFIFQQLFFAASDFREVVMSAFLHKEDQSEDEPLSSNAQRILLNH